MFAAATSLSCVFAILPAVGRGLGLGETQLAAVVAPAALVFVLCGPLWGHLGEHWPARRIVTAALLAIGACTLLFGYAIAWRLGGRISALACFVLLAGSRVVLSPFSAAMLPTAQSFIAHATVGHARQRALAAMGASFALGMVVAPGMAAVASMAGLLAPFYLVAVLLAAAALAAWRWLPPGTRHAQREFERNQAAGARAGAMARRTAWSRLWPALAALMLLYTIYGVLMQVTGFRMQDQFHLGAAQATRRAGVLLMGAAAALVAAQMALARWRVASHAGRQRLVTAACLAGLAGLAALLQPRAPFALQLLGMAAFGACLGGCMPLIVTHLTEVAHAAGDQSRVGGLSGSAQGLGMVAGPLLGAACYHAATSAPYAVSALLLAGVWLLCLRARLGSAVALS